jgi:hypothetical protein
MVRWVTLSLVFLVCAGSALAAEKPVGKWSRSAGDAKVTFEIKNEAMRILIKAGDRTIEVDADYAVSKDGHLFGRISKVSTSGAEGGPSEGDLFGFRFKVEKDKMTVSDLKSSHGVNDEARQTVEGDYEKDK